MSVLRPPVETGSDVNERLVVEQLRRVLGGEPSVASDLDPTGRRNRVRRQFVDQQYLGCVVAEVIADGGLDERGDLFTGSCPDHRGKQRGNAEFGDRVVDLLGEFERSRGIEAQRLVRHPVQLAAVRMEGRCPDRREHERGGLDGRRLPVEPVIDHVAGMEQPSGCGDPVEHVGRIDGRVLRLGKTLGAAGEELLAHFGRPRQGGEHAHRLRDVVQNAGSLSVPVVWSRCGHARKVCQASAWPTRPDHTSARVVTDGPHRQESEQP